MNVPFIDLSAQHKKLKKEILKLISDSLDKAAFIGGKNVERFEEEFAEFCQTKYCVGVSSGTDALRFALIATGISSGDEVITVPNTFIATTEAITQVGAMPIFVDIDPKTYNIDVEKIESAITKKTKAIIPVHLYGQPADMDSILKIAKKYNIKVIEDACQAHGALYNGKPVGAFGHVGCFSFYPGKNLGACGEGGAIVTNDQNIAEHIRMLRNHGQKQKYIHEIEGYNGRLDAIQAGILRIKLKKIHKWNQNRRRAAKWYSDFLSDNVEVILPYEATNVISVYHLYVILVEKRNELQTFLSKRGISTGLHYPIPLHLQTAYKYLTYKEGDFPVSEEVSKRLLSLPMFPEITEEQVKYVTDMIKEFFI